jgi:hypothetical protein
MSVVFTVFPAGQLKLNDPLGGTGVALTGIGIAAQIRESPNPAASANMRLVFLI